MKVSDGTPGLQGKWFIHNTTAAQQIVLVWKYQMGPLVYKASGLSTTQHAVAQWIVLVWKYQMGPLVYKDPWFTRWVVYPQQNSSSRNSLKLKVSDGTPGLQGEWFIHNTTAAQQIVLVWKYQMGPLVYKASGLSTTQQWLNE